MKRQNQDKITKGRRPAQARPSAQVRFPLPVIIRTTPLRNLGSRMHTIRTRIFFTSCRIE